MVEKTTQTPSAKDVAAEILRLAHEEQPVPEGIDPMRLQKLMYYVQGWSLALRGRRAFSESIEAWRLGPVVPSLYRELKASGSRAVEHDAIRATPLSEDDKAFVAGVWERYKSFSGLGLSKKTHQERPWIAARNGVPDSDPATSPISDEDMRAFFQGEFDRHAPHGAKISDFQSARTNIEAGKIVPLTDLLREWGMSELQD